MASKEDKLQFECYRWFHNHHIKHIGLLFSVPNGGYRNPREAMKLKLTGVVKGVSDLIFLWQGNTYFLELKTPTGRQGTAQKEWQEKVEKHKFKYYIIRDLKTFKKIINKIISNE